MAMCYIFHIAPPQLNISHRTTVPAQHTIPLISHHSTCLIPPDHTSHWRDVDSVIWNVLQCQMWDDVEYVQYGVMLLVMSCNVTDEVL